MQLLNTPGVITIGATAGSAEITLEDPGIGGDYGKLLNRAFQRGRHILQLPGTYAAKSPSTIECDRWTLTGFGNPVVEVDATNTNAVSIMDINSNNGGSISGIEFVTAQYVASQVMIDIAPLSGSTALKHKIKECVFTANNQLATGFTTSNGTEMSFVKITNGKSCRVKENDFYPSIGVTPLKLITGNSNKVVDNEFGNTFNAGLPEILEGQRRAAFRLIDMDREEWGVIADNTAYGIGLATPGLEAYQLSDGFYYQGPTSGTEESGHMVFRNNRMANCLSSTGAFIRLRGCQWAQLASNFMCFNGVADTAGTGFIVVEGASGATGNYSTDISFQGNHLHNPGGLTTRQCSAVYLRRVDGVTFEGNDINELYCEQAIHLDCQSGVSQTLTITAAAADNSLTRSAGNWASDGYVVGDRIAVSGLTTNGAIFVVTITELTSATKIKVSGRTLVNEGPTVSIGVKTCAVARLSIGGGNKFKWKTQTPAATRVPVLRLGTTGEFAFYSYGGGNVRENSTAAYSGTAAVGRAVSDKGIGDTTGVGETASNITANPSF